MGIVSFTAGVAGQVGVTPRRVQITTTDNFSTVTSAGYLNTSLSSSAGGNYILPTDIIDMIYSFSASTDSGTYAEFIPVFSSGVITLTQETGNTILPTIVNHIIVSTDTHGTLANLTGTAINNGNLQAGLSGTAGALISFPSAASKGSLIVSAVANTGNTNTTISNVAMGQASVISIPDPAAATANFLLDHGTNTMAAGSSIVLAKATGTEAGNAVTASANAGVITTSSLTTAGGSSYAITWTNTFISSSSAILLTLMGGTNTTKNITIQATAGSGTSTLTIYNNTASTALNGTIIIGFCVV